MSIAAARLARPLGVVFIVALAVFVALSVAGMALLLGVMPAHSTTSGGINPVPFAVPGVAFRPGAAPPDRTGWQVGYVIANRTATYVLSAHPGVLGGAAAMSSAITSSTCRMSRGAPTTSGRMRCSARSPTWQSASTMSPSSRRCGPARPPSSSTTTAPVVGPYASGST